MQEAKFNFEPFSRKQKQILTWWMPTSPKANYHGIIADGAIRSGKTISMSLSFVIWSLENFENKKFAMCGQTIDSFKRNVWEDLQLMLFGRGYKIKKMSQKGNEAYIISKGKKKNFYYFFGGRDESSYKTIQGLTLAGLFCDEVALMPESFVNQATARCSIKGSKYWFNCNPASPFHWFKLNYLDRADEKKLLHIHFMMDDNLSLDEEIKKRYYTEYVGVFFKRYILGLWVMAEGIIFSMFDEKRHVKRREEMPEKFDRKFICCDFGANNPTVFLKYGVKDGVYYELEEYYWNTKDKGDRTVGNYALDLKKFLDGDEYAVFIDPSALSFIIELKSIGITNVQAANNSVIDGITIVCTMIENNRLYVNAENKNSLRERHSYVWDAKAAERGEDAPVKQNDHAMDAGRYGIYTDYLIQTAKSRNTERKAGGNRVSRPR